MSSPLPTADTLAKHLQNPGKLDLSWLPGLIDHTLLKPEATTAQLDQLCQEAKEHSFATVCVSPVHVEYCARRLHGTKVKAITVVGFPHGNVSTKTKVFEAREAIQRGAAEIDMVLNVGLVKERALREAFLDIRKVVLSCNGVPVKVILETALLTNEEKIIACSLAKAAGAAFVKTSTGFASGGATKEDVELMRRTVGHDMGVKASGGVRTLVDALTMVAAGANRIGASSSVTIVTNTNHGAKKNAEGGY